MITESLLLNNRTVFALSCLWNGIGLLCFELPIGLPLSTWNWALKICAAF